MTVAYTPTIGLEIHAELATKTKMFCGSRNAPHDEKPNVHICPVCMGHPGTLPVINREALRRVLVVGRALGGQLAVQSEFNRKNYFYPDLPKGYQISQYAYPLVAGGSLAGVAIARVHLEEDTARLLHDKAEGSVIDFNRAGVPLMELVTEPVIHEAETAVVFARELQLLLRALAVSNANMERGEMRVEANVSVSTSSTLGTKVEVKNLNSFRSVKAAIEYEIERQVRTLRAQRSVLQETRGWDEVRKVTVLQREKESSHDYRYLPDTDLPRMGLSVISEFKISRLDEALSEIPSKRILEFEKIGLPNNVIKILVTNLDAGRFYTAALVELERLNPALTDAGRQKAAHYVTSDLFGYLGKHPGASLRDASTLSFAKLLHLLILGTITSHMTKDMLPEAVFGHADPEALVRGHGLLSSDGESELESVVAMVLAEHAGVVAAYKKGKESSLEFLIGKCMRMTRGTANPIALRKLLIQRISHIF